MSKAVDIPVDDAVDAMFQNSEWVAYRVVSWTIHDAANSVQIVEPNHWNDWMNDQWS